jgi:hypothetical protein
MVGNISGGQIYRVASVGTASTLRLNGLVAGIYKKGKLKYIGRLIKNRRNVYTERSGS